MKDVTTHVRHATAGACTRRRCVGAATMATAKDAGQEDRAVRTSCVPRPASAVNGPSAPEVQALVCVESGPPRT